MYRRVDLVVITLSLFEIQTPTRVCHRGLAYPFAVLNNSSTVLDHDV
jgi:hypothetical protein